MRNLRRIISEIEDTLWVIDPEKAAAQPGAVCPPPGRLRNAISKVMKFAQVYSDAERVKAAAWHLHDTDRPI